jgi:hypothetical protein
MPLGPAERRARASLAAHASWAKTSDRSARTANARAALEKKFRDEVDPNGEQRPCTSPPTGPPTDPKESPPEGSGE